MLKPMLGARIVAILLVLAGGAVLGWLHLGQQVSSVPIRPTVTVALKVDAEVKPVTVAFKPPLPPLPSSHTLPQPRFDYQHLNNCGPVTAMMALDMYGIEVTQHEAASVLKPGPTDRNVTMEEIQRYFASYGLNAPIRVSGDLETLKRLIAAGIPVILNQQMTLHDDIGHFRLITGYDDKAGVVIAQDSYSGPNQRLSYDVLMKLWAPYNYQYMPVFKKSDLALAKRILGDNWDVTANWQNSLKRAVKAVHQHPKDANAWWRLGESRQYTGDYQGAYKAFGQAIDIGLPEKQFWYQFTPFKTLLVLGRYKELEQLANQTLAGYPSDPEVLVYKGRALEKLDQPQKARALYQKALAADPQNRLAKEALKEVLAGR